MIQKCIITSLNINHVEIDGQIDSHKFDLINVYQKVFDPKLQCYCVFLSNKYLPIVVIEALNETNDQQVTIETRVTPHILFVRNHLIYLIQQR